MTNNPFRYLLPVSPENFVGRMPLVKKIASDLTWHDRAPDDPHYTSAYNFVHLNTDTGHGNVFLRRWSDPRHEWIEDTDSSSGGEFQFSFS